MQSIMPNKGTSSSPGKYSSLDEDVEHGVWLFVVTAESGIVVVDQDAFLLQGRKKSLTNTLFGGVNNKSSGGVKDTLVSQGSLLICDKKWERPDAV